MQLQWSRVEQEKLEQENISFYSASGMDSTSTLHKQTLTEHLAELRSCLIVSLIAVAVGFGVAYAYIRPIADWFFRPLVKVLPEGKSLIFISYQEGFFFI